MWNGCCLCNVQKVFPRRIGVFRILGLLIAKCTLSRLNRAKCMIKSNEIFNWRRRDSHPQNDRRRPRPAVLVGPMPRRLALEGGIVCECTMLSQRPEDGCRNSVESPTLPHPHPNLNTRHTAAAAVGTSLSPRVDGGIAGRRSRRRARARSARSQWRRRWRGRRACGARTSDTRWGGKIRRMDEGVWWYSALPWSR
jgi:hypothetical protein